MVWQAHTYAEDLFIAHFGRCASKTEEGAPQKQSTSASRTIGEADLAPRGPTLSLTKHALMITEEEWAAFMDDFQQSLDKFEVPQPEQEELTAIVESTKEAIVVEPLQEGPVEVS